MKRLVGITLGVVLAIALAAWLSDEPASASPPVETPPAPAVPALPTEPLDAAPGDAEPMVEGEEPPAEPEAPGVFTFEIVRAEPCDADETPCTVPVSGAVVEVRQPEDGGLVTRGTSGPDGTLPLPTLAPGFYEAAVIEPSLFSEPITFDFDGEPQFVELEVWKVARFEVRVLSPSGARVAGADVELAVDGHVIATGQTDASGAFSIERSAAGRAELRVRAPGFADSNEHFVLEGDVSKTVSLQRGRAVTVHVKRPPNGPSLLVTLSGGGGDRKSLTLGPRTGEVYFTDLPAGPLLLGVSESINVGTGALLSRPVGPGEDDVTVTLEGAPLEVHVEGPRPKSVFARGVCCASHYVELRCEGAPLRRKMLQVPGAVMFPFVPPVPCWISYDSGPEQRATPPEATLRTD